MDGSLNPFIDDPILADLHQIRAWKHKLFVVLGVGTALAVFDLRTGKRESVVDLARFLPKHFFRNPPDSDCDPFHFNSLTFTATRAFALAHNWSQPSFALELALPLFGMRHLMRLAAVHRNLGNASHDVVFCDPALYVLDGRGGRLLARRNGVETSISLAEVVHEVFPRGLAVARDHMIVGCGDWAEDRPGRKGGTTRILVLNRRSLATVLDVAIGEY